jgi:hypothetical protein
MIGKGKIFEGVGQMFKLHQPNRMSTAHRAGQMLSARTAFNRVLSNIGIEPATMRIKLSKFILSSLLLSPLAQGEIIARYTFDGNVNDSVGTAHGTATTAGTYTEAPLYVTDIPTGAISGAPTKSMEVGMSNNTLKSGFVTPTVVFNPAQGGISFWMKAGSLENQDYLFTTGTTNDLFMLALGPSTLRTRADANTIIDATVSTGIWNHVAMSWDNDIDGTNGSHKLFLNGSEVTPTDGLFPAEGLSTNIFRIGSFTPIDGNSANLANQFDGHIYDFQFYDTEITASDATFLSSNPGAVIPDPTTSANLATYQKAIGSSNGFTLRAEAFATDGIVSNFHRWRSTSATGQSLEIHYPRPVTIASTHLYTGVIASTTQENWGNFKLQSHNGTTWVDIPGGTRTGNTALEINIIFTQAVTSDQFRLLSTNGADAVRSLREIAMFGPNVVGNVEQGYPIGTGVVNNLAHKRPTTASSIDTTNYAIKAVDGYVHDSSRWLCATGSIGQTLEIDLLSQESKGDRLHAIGSAHLYSGDIATSSGALSDFNLEAWDGTAWAAIPGATITGNTSTARAITFTSSVVASKVRLVNTTTTAAKVAELLFFPPRTGGYPLGEDVQMKAPPTAKAEDFSDATRHLRVSSASLKLGLVNGNAVFTNDAAGSDALNWQLLLNHRDGSYRIRNVKNGQCLALARLTTAPNNLVIGETYTGMPHQCWFLEFVNATQFRLLNAYSGLALQSLGGSNTPGTALAVVAPGSSALQRWDTVWQAHHPKKGIAATGNPFPELPTETNMSYFYGKFQHTSWSYSWGRTDEFPFMATNHTFNPMQWGDFFWAHGDKFPGPLENDRVSMQSQGKPFSFLGFNEPDGVDQANMTIARAIALWPRLQSMDAPLVAPCPANPFFNNTTGIDWNADFFEAAEQLGYRIDYTPLHNYSSPNASNLINRIKQLYTAYGRPVWLTEFSSVRWSGTSTWTHASNYNFLAEFMWRAENLPELARYSLFNWRHEPTSPIDPAAAPRGNSLDQNGNLTPFGELYASWDCIAEVRTQKAYHLHNHGRYQRLQSPATGDTLGFVTPDNSGAGTQWFLLPGTTANTYRIKNTRDGRPLSRTSGNPAAMGTPGQTDTATEWTLVPVTSGANHDGWYYLQHPLTNQRLKNNGNDTFSMVAATDTSNDSRWRFIVPLTPDGGILYQTWIDSSFANPFTTTAMTENPDGDAFTNLQEFAFGMDPTDPATRELAFTIGGQVTQTGPPQVRNLAGIEEAPADFRAVFTRRKDHLAAGLTYTAQFSADLIRWEPSTTPPTVLTAPGSSGNIEAVSIPFPPTVPTAGTSGDQKPNFVRLVLSGS